MASASGVCPHLFHSNHMFRAIAVCRREEEDLRIRDIHAMPTCSWHSSPRRCSEAPPPLCSCPAKNVWRLSIQVRSSTRHTSMALQGNKWPHSTPLSGKCMSAPAYLSTTGVKHRPPIIVSKVDIGALPKQLPDLFYVSGTRRVPQ